MQNRITKAGRLLNDKGELAEAGYSTSLLREYRRADIRAGKGRIKEWDYYCVLNDRFGIALTVDDNGYMGMDSFTLLDFESRSDVTRSFIRWFPYGSTGLPSNSWQGETKTKGSGYCAAFTHVEGQSRHGHSARRLTAHVDRFDRGEPLDVELLLTDEPEDSMVIHTPFPEKPGHFYYNQKINCLRASGVVTVGERRYVFDPADSLGVLDWGRGVWTYRNTWYWSSLSCLVDGVPVGFNLGYGFGDTSAASENMVFYNGKAHKLTDVDFGIPQKNGKDDFLSLWHFTSTDSRVQLTFTPLYDRASDTNALLIRSDQHQVFGRFSGKLVLDDGREVLIKDKLGFAEKVSNKW